MADTTLEEVRARHEHLEAVIRVLLEPTATDGRNAHADRAFLLDYIAQREREREEEVTKVLDALKPFTDVAEVLLQENGWDFARKG